MPSVQWLYIPAIIIIVGPHCCAKQDADCCYTWYDVARSVCLLIMNFSPGVLCFLGSKVCNVFSL